MCRAAAGYAHLYAVAGLEAAFPVIVGCRILSAHAADREHRSAIVPSSLPKKESSISLHEVISMMLPAKMARTFLKFVIIIFMLYL